MRLPQRYAAAQSEFYKRTRRSGDGSDFSVGLCFRNEQSQGKRLSYGTIKKVSFIEPLPNDDEDDDDTDSYEETETEQEYVDNIDEAVAKEVFEHIEIEEKEKKRPSTDKEKGEQQQLEIF